MRTGSLAAFAALFTFAATTVSAGGFTVKTDEMQLSMGGTLQSDWSILDEDKSIEALANQNGGHQFRRARVSVSGTLYDSILFKVEYDFAGGDADFKDAYIGIQGSFGTVKMGHMKEPNGLEALTSANHTTFLERGLPFALNPGRNAGIQYSNAFGGSDDVRRATVAFGVFKDADDYGTAHNENDWAFSGRLSGLPYYQSESQLLHVGGSFRIAETPANAVRYASRPESWLSDRYVDTGLVEGIDNATTFGIEAAYVQGPLSLQGEWTTATLDGAGDPQFQGFYVGGSMFLSRGDHRSYKTSAGTFGRVTPNDSWTGKAGKGAWEVAARYSNLDLTDGDIIGGELDDITLGLNWYPNPNTRFMFNWVRADLDDVGKSNAFLARFQVEF